MIGNQKRKPIAKIFNTDIKINLNHKGFEAMRQVVEATPWDHIVVSISGGKDSAAQLAHICERFKDQHDRIQAIHCMIDLDWSSTKQLCIDHCKAMGVPLKFLHAVDKDGKPMGYLDYLVRPRRNRKTGEMGEQMQPSKNNKRWCTQALKIGPTEKYLNSLRGNVLDCVGERAKESHNRSTRLSDPNNMHKLVKDTPSKGRKIFKYHPIADWSESDSFLMAEDNGLAHHPCYSWGIPRASCAICVFSAPKDLIIAAEKEPEMVAKYRDAEKKIAHTWFYQQLPKKDGGGVLKATVGDIIDGTHPQINKIIENQIRKAGLR